MATAIKMVHDRDPRDVLLERVAKINVPVVMGARVLVATYVRPEKTSGGIYMPDKSRDEEKHQGKCGLIIAMGPLAFQDDAQHVWGETKPRQHDWIMYNIGDTRRFVLGDVECRWMEDVHVAGIIVSPDEIL